MSKKIQYLSFWQSTIFFCDKNVQQIGYRRNRAQNSKGHTWQTHNQHYTLVKDVKAFLLNIGTREGCQLSPFLLNILLKVLVKVIKEGEKRHPNKKGRSKIVFVSRWYDLTYRKSEGCHKKTLLELIIESCKGSGYEIDIQKTVFLYLNNRVPEKENLIHSNIKNNKKYT